MKIRVYDYRGLTIVVVPDGKAMVHGRLAVNHKARLGREREVSEIPLMYESSTFDDAKRWVDAHS